MLQVVNPPQPPVVVAPRKKTLPIVVFMMVMAATLGTAFVLENVRPAVRIVPGSVQDEQSSRPYGSLGPRAEDPGTAKSA